MTRRRPSASSLSTIAIAIAIAIAAGSGPAATLANPAAPLNRTAVHTLADAETGAGIPGVLKPWRSVVLGAPVEATILEVPVREGQRVEAGDPVAVMDNRVELAQVAAARHAAGRTARLERAEAAFDIAELIAERTRAAHDRNAAGDAELEEALARLETARAEVADAREAIRAAELELELAEARLERRTVRAPFAGLITRVEQTEGASLRSGDAIATLDQRTVMRAEVRLGERAAADAEVGRMYALRALNEERTIVAGELVFVEPRIEPASGTLRAVFRVDNPDHRLKAGCLVEPASPAEAVRLRRTLADAAGD
jgi:RND family efflux transporter MFP subunit